MRKVIIDSNIVFAGLRSVSTSLRAKLANEAFRFYAPKFLFVEIFKHKERILEKSLASEDEILKYLSILLHYISFVDESIISTSTYLKAYNLCKDIDENDTSFMALTLAMDGQLWTRDKILIIGLRKKGFDNFFDENSVQGN